MKKYWHIVFAQNKKLLYVFIFFICLLSFSSTFKKCTKNWWTEICLFHCQQLLSLCLKAVNIQPYVYVFITLNALIWFLFFSFETYDARKV